MFELNKRLINYFLKGENVGIPLPIEKIIRKLMSNDMQRKCATQGTMPKERDDDKQKICEMKLSLACDQEIQICILQIKSFAEIKISKRSFEKINAIA